MPSAVPQSAARCPHPDPIPVGEHRYSAAAITQILEPYLTDRRREKIERVLRARTYSITPVLEGLYDRGNVSAVLRSSEAMGYQSVHIIETQKKFKQATRVTQGAEKWLDIQRYKATAECIDKLRTLGYRIVATHVKQARPITDFSFTEPMAIVFGNEKEGVSDELLAQADARLIVPMDGFTRSFNISVAAALTLYHIRTVRQAEAGHGDLGDGEIARLRAVYYLRCVKFADQVLRESGAWVE